MAIVALQGVRGRLDHVCGRPVHISGGKAVLSAVLQACDRRSQFEGAVPIKGGPEAARARGERLEQVVVDRVVRLLCDMQFEREYLGVGVFDVARRFVDISRFGWVDLVAQDVAIFVVAVEPQIGRLEVLLVGEFALDLQISKVIVDAAFLPGL